MEKKPKNNDLQNTTQKTNDQAPYKQADFKDIK
jgi:hypothetical protein